MKHLKAAALQSLKNQQTAEYQYAMELFSQVMDSLIPELTVNAALDSLTTTSSADGLVVQALEDAEREARDEWMAELKEKELKCQQQRTKLMQRKREQMIHSYICREGWETTEDNRLKAAQNAAAEKMQKMFRAKRSGVPYGLHNGDGTYKRRKKQTAKPKDKRVLKAEAKLAKEMQEAAVAERQADSVTCRIKKPAHGRCVQVAEGLAHADPLRPSRRLPAQLRLGHLLRRPECGIGRGTSEGWWGMRGLPQRPEPCAARPE